VIEKLKDGQQGFKQAAEGEDVRLDAETEDLSKIKVARAERSGDISFIKAQ
jgi:hypothetical protein